MLKYFIFFIVSFLHFAAKSQAVGFSINCIQTNAANQNTITWTPFLNPLNDFVEYQVHSVQNGLLSTIPSLATTNYIGPSSTSNINYFIVAVSGAGGTTQTVSDTTSNIHLQLNNPTNGTAVLQWNDPISSPTPSMGTHYKIYREYPVGTWILRDSVTYGTRTYRDTIDICEAFLNYKIILQNEPCEYVSNVVGDDFNDILSPDIPIITNVTIDTLTSNVTINWNQNSQNDTYGYIVYLLDANGFTVEIDTVWGLTNTSYTYSPNINAGALTYSLSAFDSCFTASSVPTYQTSAKAETHTTIFVRSTVGVCDNKVTLTWTDYKGWSDLSTYEIWGHIIGDPWVKLGSTTGTSYWLFGEALADYCFVIRAVSSDGDESFSNLKYLTIIAPSQPSFNYLKVATVENEKIELRHMIDLVSGVKSLSFQRLNKKGAFEEIGVNTNPTSSNIFIDSLVDVSDLSYTYRVVVIDSCGNSANTSNTARTILLQVKTDNEHRTHYLNWSAYSNFNGSILGYKIYRSFSDIYSSVLLATLPNSQFYYEDELAFYDTLGKACYYIDAIEGPNIYGDPEYSKSNVACAILDPLIYAPNTFTPNGDGTNEIFLPIISYNDYSFYHLIIFDRWEHVLYETSDARIGWNGNIKETGKMACDGTYFYLLNIKDGNGVEILKQGYVNLLR